MKENKRISTKELIERMKASRRRPLSLERIEKFNKILEKDIKSEQAEELKQEKRVARSAEVNS